MKKRNYRILASALISLALLIGILGGAVANSLIGGSTAGGSRLTPVGNLNLDALRNLYLSEQVKEYQRYNYTGTRWVIVEFEGKSLYEYYQDSKAKDSFEAFCASDVGAKYRKQIEDNQRDFLNTLEKSGVKYTYKYSYSTLNNGVAIRVGGSDCRKIKNLSGVKDIYFSERYATPKVAVSNNANVYTTGIYNTTGINYTGEGMVVAVLDTGLDWTHEAFAMDMSGLKVSLKKDDVARIMKNATRFYANASADDVYYSAKVPFAYDYADDDADVYPQYSSHGTHVAGIVAGKSDYVVNKETGEKFIGVAPDAQLVIGKVFSDNIDNENIGGANAVDILAALNDCVELGVDVINMSLGSSAGFSDAKSDTFTNEVYERVRAAGISLVVAASNDYSSGFGGGNGTNLATNPDSGTVGSPSTYPAALSVASINGQMSAYMYANGDTAQIAFITEASDGNGNKFNFVDQLYEQTGKTKDTLLNYKYVVINGVGRPSNYTAQIKKALNDRAGYDGVIALVKRGDITFAEKVQNAMDNGADAVIIYNNLSGTISMSLGDVDHPVPTCSITMDAAKALVDNAKKNVGTLTIGSSLKAGPFMSDFSSWGPTPDLHLRPEITAHGGEITSSVAGGYDIYSGTSMAAPNMAGAVALLRQYVKDTTGLSGTALNALVNQLLMSTATIALNEEGNPYSPRKQGAGLATIKSAINSEGYITVKDKNGNIMDKTKIELFDDKLRTGVYEFTFTINNMTGKETMYRPNVYVMTETLASDNKTVAEKSYMFHDSKVTYTVGGNTLMGSVSVPSNGSVDITVRIELSSAAKKYIDDSFKNGMYVEGFVSLQAEGETKVTLGIPYLAFYGDWNDAPLFDYSEYELAESQKDTSVPPEDKLVTSAASTRVIGKYHDGKYVLPMGTYIYTLDDSDVQIYPEKEKIAVSRFDTDGQHTIYELYMVYAGLLRGAAYMDITVTDSVTGDVVYSHTQENIGKSYAGGGAARPSAIMLEINPAEWNLINNGTYQVSLKGQLDYKDGDNPDRGDFDFQFTVDYEAPQVLDYRIRYESYTENKQTKYRIWMDVDVFDNQYVQDLMPCYIRKTETGEDALTLVTDHPIPVYGEKGKQSTVSFEITDIYEEYVKAGKLYLAVEDYALNQKTYAVNAPNGLGEAGKITLTPDEYLKANGEVGYNSDEAKTPYNIYDLTLAPNQLYKPMVEADAESGVAQNLVWKISEGSDFVMTKNEEIFPISGSAGKDIVMQLGYHGMEEDEFTIVAEVTLHIRGEEKKLADPEKVGLEPALDEYYHVVNIDSVGALTLNPNMTVSLRAVMTPWYRTDVKLKWQSSNESVATVDEDGNLVAVSKGAAYITVEAEGYARLKKSFRVSVNSEFRVTNYILYNYYGGEECRIPDNLNVSALDEDCFRNNKTVKRIILPKTLTQIPANAFVGCDNLEYIEINSQCTVIGSGAFEGCKNLKTIVFRKFADRNGKESDLPGTISIGKAAFRNCVNLSQIENEQRITAIHESAFEGCSSLTSIDIRQLRFGGKNAFAKCTSLTTVQASKNTSFGEGMFSGCTGLTSFEYPGDYLPATIFNNCRKLTSIRFTSENFRGIGERALANTGIRTITLPNGSYSIGKGAFNSCTKLETVQLSDNTVFLGLSEAPFEKCNRMTAFEISANNQNYKVIDGLLLNSDCTELVAVPFGKTGISQASLPSTVKSLASGVFSGIRGITEWNFKGFTSVGAYAFAGSGLTTVDLNGMTELPEGIFSGCDKLTTVTGTESLVTIGKSAFAACLKLNSLSLPALKNIEANAFASSGLTSITAPLTERVGMSAFESTKLSEINFPHLTTLDYRAFATMPELRKVILGDVTSMGSYVFSACPKLEEATFGEGTTIVGSFAFYDGSTVSNLTRVTLPDSVKEIGSHAFAATGITEINLRNVVTVGEAAFDGCNLLQRTNLSSAVTIGDFAFRSTALTSVDLSNSETIGARAFYGVPLESVTFGKLCVLGEHAFAKTLLKTVTLPETFENATYDYRWNIYDEKGRVTEERVRRIPCYGAGAFSEIASLKEILVLSKKGVYISLDGVLYVNNENGLTLLQYPLARSGSSYKVADGTVAIGASAFECPEKYENENALKSVEFPYTLKQIGEYAFYRSKVSDYTFNSVEAPILLSEYVAKDQFPTNNILGAIFGESSSGNALESTIYYANFADYVAKRVYKDIFNPSFFQSEDFGLHLTVPKNGIGYDTVIWTNFFGDIQKTDHVLPNDTTHEAIDKINKLTETSLESIAGAKELSELDAIANATLAARRAYNKVTLSDQIAIIEEQYQILLQYEKALRDAKERLGAPVLIESLDLAVEPKKIRYRAGENFDPTGMVIKAIYSDGSEICLTEGNYVLDKTVLSAKDESVTVSFTDHGQTYTVIVKVNVERDPNKTPDKLATPVVTVSDKGIASWAPIANATGYRYRIGDGEEMTTTETEIQLKAGDVLRVSAIGDGIDYTDSDYSESVTYTVAEDSPSYAIVIIVASAVVLAGGVGLGIYLIKKKKKGI